MTFLAFLPIVDKLITRIFPDEEKRNEARLQFVAMQNSQEAKMLEHQMSSILAEANGDSWLQRNWRPLTMLSFVSIIVNNYIIYPYLSLFWSEAPVLPVPVDLWDLIKIGLGGYVVGRSVEKTAKALNTSKLPWQKSE